MASSYGEIKEVSRSDQLLSLEWKVPIPFRCNCYKSPCFSFCDGRWFMRLSLSNDALWMNFSLRRDDDGTPKTLNVTVCLKGSNRVQMRNAMEQKFTREEPYWYASRFRTWNVPLTITLEMKIPANARGAVPCPVLPIEIDTQRRQTNTLAGANQLLDKQDESEDDEESESSEEDESEDDEESESSEEEAMEELQTSFRNLLKSEEDCDVVIKVQGKEFRAHRNILRARSPVFNAMFAHDMVEKQKGVVTMEDCDPGNFTDFLDHIYTCSVAMISAKNVFSLFQSSDKYDFKMLRKKCAKFMKKNITVDFFCDVIMLGVRHNEKELIDCATEFFCRNSLDIVKTPKWQIFLKENTTVGNELFIKLLSKHESIFRNTS